MSRWDRFAGWFLSRRNLFGMGVAASAALPGLLLGPAWWPLLAAAGYAIGVLIAGPPGGTRLDLTAEAEARNIRKALDRVVGQARRETDPQVTNAFERLRAEALPLVAALEREPGGGPQLTVLGQMAFEYLPTTLASYLRVPGPYRRVRRSGRSARSVLLEQLELLRAQLDEMEADVVKRDLEALARHGEFLRTRFADPLTW